MAYKLTGTIKDMGDLKTFESGFSKQDVIIETDGAYAQSLKVQFLKERADLLVAYKVNDRVVVDFDIRGSEKNGNHFVNLVGFKIQYPQVSN